MSSNMVEEGSGPRARRRRGQVPAAWVGLLCAHARLTRSMDAHLRTAHGLSLNAYEALLHLQWAPEHRMRPVDLARGVLLTQGGVTRLLDGLERAGLVERARCATDGRVVFACLTPAGQEVLRDAATTHVADVRELFADRFSAEELQTLSDLLARLPGGGAGAERLHPVR